RVHQILKLFPTGTRQDVDECLGSEEAVQLEELEDGPTVIQLPLLRRDLLHPDVVRDPGRQREGRAEKEGRAAKTRGIQAFRRQRLRRRQSAYFLTHGETPPAIQRLDRSLSSTSGSIPASTWSPVDCNVCSS